MHYVVNPVGFGTYENVEILEELRKAGYRADLKDKEGCTPLDFANLQQSGVLANKLREIIGANASKRQNRFVRQSSFTPLQNWPAIAYDPEADSNLLLTEAEERNRK